MWDQGLLPLLDFLSLPPLLCVNKRRVQPEKPVWNVSVGCAVRAGGAHASGGLCASGRTRSAGTLEMPEVSGEKELPRNCGNAAFGGWEKKSKNFFPEIPCIFFPDALFEMAGLCGDEPMS